MDVKLPDGTIIKDVPDGTTKAELTAKLKRLQPTSLGQAGRIEGMTPAALTLLVAHLRKLKRARAVA